MTRRIRRLLAVAALCASGVGVALATHSPVLHSAGLGCGGGTLARVADGTGRVVIDGWGPTHGGCS